jgi:hypothetical protein
MNVDESMDVIKRGGLFLLYLNRVNIDPHLYVP